MFWTTLHFWWVTTGQNESWATAPMIVFVEAKSPAMQCLLLPNAIKPIPCTLLFKEVNNGVVEIVVEEITGNMVIADGNDIVHSVKMEVLHILSA